MEVHRYGDKRIPQPAGIPYTPCLCDETQTSDTIQWGGTGWLNTSVTEINCLAHREGTGVLLSSHYLIVLIYDYSDYHYYAM